MSIFIKTTLASRQTRPRGRSCGAAVFDADSQRASAELGFVEAVEIVEIGRGEQ